MISSRLGLFLWAFAQFTVLQCVRSIKSMQSPYILAALLTASGYTQFVSPDSLVSGTLMLSSFIALSAIEGSLSNHVVTSASLACLVLACASKDRKLVERQSQRAVSIFAAVVYLVTGIHKLNSGFFTTEHSCASLYVAGAISALPLFLLDFPVVFNGLSSLLRLAPIGAAVLELSLGILIPIAVLCELKNLRRSIVLAGSLFHAVLALPPSPLSVYPFSAIMVPIYVMLAPDTVVLESVVSRLIKPVWSKALIGMLFAVAFQYAPSSLFDQDRLYEYPNYDLWSASLVWNILWWSVIFGACLSTPQSNDRCSPTVRIPFFGKVVLFFLFLFAMTPYIGMRNYPALAMFSNIRTEGDIPNHWTIDFDLFNYQKDWVEIQASNLDSISKFQIDLGELFPDKLKSTLDRFGLAKEFIICPPSWELSEGNYSTFDDFNIPFIELRRRLSAIDLEGTSSPLFVDYIRHFPDGQVKQYHFDSTKVDPLDESVRSLNLFEKLFVRFRSFSNKYSPCRH